MSHDFNNGFEEWGGYMDAKITKLEEQFAAASDPYRKSNLFAGISIYVNGHTNPSATELKHIMMVHGGTYHHYERAHTTYIIASHLPDVKVRNMNTSKIISPQWVVDCVQEQRILDYTHYLLYTNQRSTQPRLDIMLKKKQQTTGATEIPSIIRDVSKLSDKTVPSEQSVHAITNSATTGIDNVKAKEEGELRHQQNTYANSSTTSISNAARTAVDPRFLSEFYNNSRLHHIATLGAGFKQYINELRQRRQSSAGAFPCRAKLRNKLLIRSNVNKAVAAVPDSNPCIMHIDMDCFFVSVGLRKYPHLRGQPLAVTHSKGGAAATEVPVHADADREAEMELFAKRFEQHLHNNILADKVRQGFDNKMSLSEIASCSYEARAKGIRNGMFVGQAMKLCPELKTIPYDFEGYREVAYTLYDTIAQYTLNIEAVSCDEMFVELTDLLEDLQVAPMTFVSAIREEVRQRTGCPCSAGVGANKLQARMATKHAKPDGQYQLLATDVEAYMAPIPITDLPGVGSTTAHTLKQANLLTCGDLQKVLLPQLQTYVGKKLGETLMQFCRGVDSRPLVYGQIRKSVSAEVNYGIRFSEYSELETFLRQLCTEVHTRLTDIQRRTKCITLKLMVRAKDAPQEASKFMGHGVCDYVTKSVSLSNFTNDLETITRTVLTTMKALSLPPNELRGIGIQLTKLDEPLNESKEKKENIIKNMFAKINVKQQQQQQQNQNATLQQQTFSTDEREPTIANLKEEAEEVKLSSSSAKPPAKKLRARTATAAAARNNANASKKPSNNIDILQMLQNVATKKSTAINEKLECPPGVDAAVFAELPHHIRAEIVAEYEQKEAICIPGGGGGGGRDDDDDDAYVLSDADLRPSTSRAAAQQRLELQCNETFAPPPSPPPLSKQQVQQEFLQALPPDIRAEIQMQLRAEEMQENRIGITKKHELRTCEVIEYERPPDELFGQTNTNAMQKISIDNIFAQNKCIELLLEWVESSKVPEQYDIYLICLHAQEFVRVKRIDQLYDPLMYLCRLINTQESRANDCAWHAAYKQLIEAVQSEMRAIYEGRKLFLGVQLSCDKCCLV